MTAQDQRQAGFNEGLQRAVSICFTQIHAVENKAKTMGPVTDRDMWANASIIAVTEIAEIVAAIRQQMK